MNTVDKINRLRAKIDESLSGLIDRDYYLLELPYYTNVGDSLIWQGELDFLRKFPYKCKGMYSLETFIFPDIPDNSLILFQGGGNFGDLWAKHHDFKMEVMRRYPHNKYVFFPQTVFFQNEDSMKRCADFMSYFGNVTICARDERSYRILSDNFQNHILLVPDMAFCVDMKHWHSGCNGRTDLLLKRLDKEYSETPYVLELLYREDMDITDWPTMNRNDTATRLMYKLRDSHRLPKFLADVYARVFYRRYLITIGRNILASHRTIYSTRLHAAILGVLLDKEVVLLDNSYGKNKSFFDTWLFDCDKITFVGE